MSYSILPPSTILKAKQEEVFDYFLTQRCYINFELPEYFEFASVLEQVKQSVGDKTYEECLSDNAETLHNANAELLLNKDGKYGVRPLIIANPYLYYFLVREICGKEGWAIITDCFKKFELEDITACAIPLFITNKEPYHNSATILNWWKCMEQQSVELSLDYRYMFATDITNCYGSIDPQTIEWALNCKGTSFETNENCDKAKRITRILAAFQNGRNIGIPQGSVIFDFVAELVLGYSDLLLHEELKKLGIEGYRIIRYRDDYRIFCNSKSALEKISYTLQHVLEALNLRLNGQKTKMSDDIVTDSIKSEKLWYIKNTPIMKKNQHCDFDGLYKHLLFILQMGREFPNCGMLKTLLSDFDKRVIDILKPKDIKPIAVLTINGEWKKGDEVEATIVPGRIWESCKALAAVGVRIAQENVGATHYALRTISRIVNSMEDEDAKWEIFDKVINKLQDRPNNTYDQIWLQNISYQRDLKNGDCPYSALLCRYVMDKDVEIWNNAWLKPELTKGLPTESICNEDRLKELTPLITFRETRSLYEDFDFDDILDFDFGDIEIDEDSFE